ncbi:MAG: hypothetical protein JWO12_402 [Frankiales bacterium]|nr:hypothetical protein [Frankiales bacterium]
MRRGESRVPPSLAVIGALAAQTLLTDPLVPGPRFLVPGLEALLLLGLLAADPSRLSPESKDLRVVSIGFIGLLGVANGYALVTLVDRLVNGGGSGRVLLAAAAGVWLTNVVVFGLAYWELDRGGPLGRAGARPAPPHPDLWFPQDGDAKDAAPHDWAPVFLDYFYVSLTAASAFSPTDTMPLTPRSKLLMGLQSLVSLLTVGLVAARAVNILG